MTLLKQIKNGKEMTSTFSTLKNISFLIPLDQLNEVRHDIYTLKNSKFCY